jgi:hypothetical protein
LAPTSAAPRRYNSASTCDECPAELETASGKFEIQIPKSEANPNVKGSKQSPLTEHRVLSFLAIGESVLVSDFEFSASRLGPRAYCPGLRREG